MGKESGNKLLPIKEALLLKDEQEIFAQVDMRRKLISEMVGRLYPSILEGEIEKLFNRIHWLRYPIGDFQI
jgi:hypothetical protein